MNQQPVFFLSAIKDWLFIFLSIAYGQLTHLRKRLIIGLACCLGLAGCMHERADLPQPATTDSQTHFSKMCLSFADQSLGKTIRITDHQMVPPSSLSPEYCKLTVAFIESSLKFNLWLPSQSWNKKIAFLGGGGFDGQVLDESSFKWISRSSPSILNEGYALVSTNGGHDKPESLDPLVYFKAEFAADAEALADFTYRSEHRSLPQAKSLITAFYGEAPKYTYFEGCSMGGHDALLLSQRYPQDFDGIVARAPAGNVVGLFQQFNRIGSLVHDKKSLLSAKQKDSLANAVLAQCDNMDGLIDGIISNSEACEFDPSVLSCLRNSVDNCLSADQLKLVNAITSPLVADDGKIIHPGYNFGGENQDFGWGEYIWPKISGPSLQMLFSEGFVRSFVTGDAHYDTWSWKAEEWQPELNKIKEMFDAVYPNLEAFNQQGAKLIMWNGMLDTSVSSRDSIRYYKAVLNTLGHQKTDQTLELFLAPGVGHCGGGIGPDRVDLMQALSRWVEADIPPSQQQLVMTKVDDDEEIVLSRPMCKYPAYAKYKGKGDIALAASFACESR